MLDLCRFCGYKGSNLHSLIDNKVLIKFYKILPIEITCDDIDLPQTFCQLCNLKIVEILEFFDRIAEVDRDLRIKRESYKPNVEIPVFLDTSTNQTNQVNNVDKMVIKNNSSIKEIPGRHLNSLDVENDPLDISDGPFDNENEIKLEESSNNEYDYEDIEYLYTPERKRKNSNSLITNQAKTTKVSNGNEVIIIDVSNSKYVCCKCQESFQTAKLLKNHLFVVSACREADLICKFCDKKLKTRRQRIKHELIHIGKKQIVSHGCTNCSREFTSRALLAIHHLKCTSDAIGGHLEASFKCTECGEIFTSRSQLMKHTDHHAISKKIRKHLACEICGQTFDTKPLYHDHIRIHPEMATFMCELCDKKYHTARLLHTHRYEHSGVKSNICQDCGKAYVKKSSLNNHRRREHTGETPYLCQICNMHFPTTDRLKIHQYKHIFKD